MQKTSLQALGRQLRRAAGDTGSGRAADTVHGGHEKALRQTVVALMARPEAEPHIRIRLADVPGGRTYGGIWAYYRELVGADM